MPSNISAMINMSYAELIVVSTSIHTFMLRDATEFAAYGTDSADISAFMTKITDFTNLPADVEVAELMIGATAMKNTIAEELRVILRGFTERARLAFGTDDSRFARFYSKDFSKLPDKDLLFFGRVVKRSADLYATDLLPFGVTALMITALDAKNTEFALAIDDQLEAIANRDEATNNRSNKAIELYGMLISFCETGKVIWFGVNPALYNDYVIFGPGGNLLTLIPPYDFAYDSTANKFMWSVISNATSYEIEQSLNHVDWTQLWTGTAIEYAYVPPGGVSIEFRCRARNSSGYGPYCDPITIIYVEPLPAPATVAVTADYSLPPNVYLDLSWAAVPGATFYKVFESMVNFGQPEGTFTDIGDFVLESMRKLSLRNRRYYFKVHACNTATQSGDSMTVYVDIPG